MSKDPSMINHFESFGAITLSDALNMVNHMSNYYLQHGTDEKHTQALNLIEYILGIPQLNPEKVYITAIPIEVFQIDRFVEHLPILSQILEDFYELKDVQLQRIKHQMQESRFILEYVSKAVKTHGKIQARKTSSFVGKS